MDPKDIHNEKLRSGIISLTWKLLAKEEKKKVIFVTLAQVFLAFLDLIAVSLVGLIGALTISGIQSRQPGTRLSTLLEFLNLGEVRFQAQVAILGLIAAVLLVLKTILSMYFTRRILFYLSYRSAILSSKVVKKLFTGNLAAVQRRSSQETLYALTIGTNALMLNIVGTVIGVVSDSVLLIILSVALISVDPLMAFVTALLFGSVGILLYRLVHERAIKLGEENSRIAIKSNESILEVLTSFREVYVRNRQSFYSKQIGDSRLELAENSAQLAFMPNIGKYIIEITLVVGGICVAGLQFALNDATHAIATLSVFLAAATRIAPAVLRLQSAAITVKSNTGLAEITLDLISFLEPLNTPDIPIDLLDRAHIGFTPRVSLQNVTFRYSDANIPTINGVDLEINPGEFVALVGPSGAGKSTLVDIILGIQPPSSGEVIISGVSPSLAATKWPGAIGYVPQEVFISNTSLGSNVRLGYLEEPEHDPFVLESLEIAKLGYIADKSRLDVSYSVGERGSKLSGGQRQRLGIARAMFTNPMLLVLDEATSSLDGKTESNITESIQGLRGRVTVLMIAHRLASIRNADKVIYLDNGKIIASGTFEEVKARVPDFQVQASLMGL